MELIEKEDGMLARPAIRELREKLGTKAYEVMSEQRCVRRKQSPKSDEIRRIGCMLQGSWFNPAILIVIGITSSAKPNQAKPLRFLRLVSEYWLNDTHLSRLSSLPTAVP